MRRTVAFLILTLLTPILAIVLSSTLHTVNATDASGIISEDTVWRVTSSPYIITGDVTVESNVTLTIQPGVEVKFDGNYSLTIKGSLRALGSSDSKIIFTSNMPEPARARGDWSTIKFAGAEGELFTLEHCLIEYATNGITIESSQNATVKNSRVVSNLDSGIRVFNQNNLCVDGNLIELNGNGITCTGDIITGTIISNNSILHNDKYGVYMATNGSIENPRAPLSDISVSNNNVSFNEYGIYLLSFTRLSHVLGSYIRNVTVTNNTVYFNDYGIYFETYGFYDTHIYNILISQNRVFLSRYGISIDAGGNWNTYAYETTVSDNIVASNERGISYTAHHYDLVTFDLTVTRNVFSSNYIGIFSNRTARLNVTQNSVAYNTYGVQFVRGRASEPHVAHYNDIYGNYYGMYVEEVATVDAENNYWGDSTGPSHELNLGGEGDAVNGDGTNLDYDPFLQSATGVINMPPMSSFQVDKRRVAVNQTITIDGSASTDDQNVQFYTFSFGDGTTSGWTSSSVVTHSYSSAGTYTVRLAVMDNLGALSRNVTSISITVTEGLVPLVVTVSSDYVLVFPGQNVTLTVEVTDGDYPIAGATVALASDKEGTFSREIGFTDANGSMKTTFNGTEVTSQTTGTITADAAKEGYQNGEGQIELAFMPSSSEDGEPDLRILALALIAVVIVAVVVVIFILKRR